MNRSTRELAEEIDKLKDSGHELDGYERADVTTAPVKERRDVFSMRVAATELVAIERAAKASGQTIGDFIRTAALEKAAFVASGARPAGEGPLELVDALRKSLIAAQSQAWIASEAGTRRPRSKRAG